MIMQVSRLNDVTVQIGWQLLFLSGAYASKACPCRLELCILYYLENISRDTNHVPRIPHAEWEPQNPEENEKHQAGLLLIQKLYSYDSENGDST